MHNWERDFTNFWIQTSFPINFGGKLSFIPSFLFSDRLHSLLLHIFSLLLLGIIIILKPCALNAEFQHFILRFNKIWVIPLKEGIRGESRGDKGVKERVTLQITLISGLD
jgi:hypothetical protein